jgi:large-conductance mechanosensitive channel
MRLSQLANRSLFCGRLNGDVPILPSWPIGAKNEIGAYGLLFYFSMVNCVLTLQLLVVWTTLDFTLRTLESKSMGIKTFLYGDNSPSFIVFVHSMIVLAISIFLVIMSESKSTTANLRHNR